MKDMSKIPEVADLLDEEQPFDSSDPKRGGWGHLEIMGRREYYGFVREISVFGAIMAEVLVPFEDKPGVQIRKAFGGQAIFSCSPSTKEECLRYVPRDWSAPSRPQLTLGAWDDGDEDADEPDGDDIEEAHDVDVLPQRDHEQATERGEREGGE